MTRPSFSAVVRCAVLTVGIAVAATAITKASSADFRVYNAGSTTIMVLNVEPSGYNSWGPDLLGNNELDPGYYVRPLVGYTIPSCVQDVRAVYSDNVVQYYLGDQRLHPEPDVLPLGPKWPRALQRGAYSSWRCFP